MLMVDYLTSDKAMEVRVLRGVTDAFFRFVLENIIEDQYKKPV
jgi:hypothetical protein